MSRKGKKKLASALFHFYGIFVYAFLYIPVIVMIAFSFNDSKNNTIWRGFTTQWYVRLMQDSEIWEVLGTTFLIAVFATVVAVVLGTLGAVGFSKAKFKGKTLISTMLYVPIVIPEIVLAVATLLVLKKVGLGLGMLAMVLGNITLVLPYIFITVKSRLAGMDASIEEASLDLGANRFYTFMHVTLPNILPGVVSGGFMAFTLAFGDLIICSFLANATSVTLPMKVYSQLKRGIKPEINALSTVILIAFLTVIFLYKVIGIVVHRRQERESLSKAAAKKEEGQQIETVTC